MLLDQDLADLYGVETRALVQQVKRNADRFPDDFMFQVSTEELNDLKSQSVIASGQHGGRRSRPLAFTEQGVAMLSSVLRSKRAVAVNIEIMRAFVEIRRAASNYKKLEQKINELEKNTAGKLGEHEKHLTAIFKVLKQLTALPPPRKPKKPIGFSPPENDTK